jgi:DNA invertase Pin-like site-specific DNA recombinase
VTKKAYSYLRFSTPEQMRGDSFRRQGQLAQDYARRHGLTLDEKTNYHDLGVSAYRGRNAETGRLADFLEAVRGGLVPRGSYLLVESLDRISRQAARKALRVLEDLCEEDITVVTLSDNRAYNKESLDNDPMALMMSLMIFIRANEESAMKSRRLKAAWEAKRSKVSDKPLTAVAPSWLTLDRSANGFRVIEERATVIRRIFSMTLEGFGQNRVAETLNREAVPVFGDGRHWHRSFVVKLLTNVAVTGTLIPHRIEYIDGTKVRKPLEPVPGYYPAVIDPDTFARVQSLRQDAWNPRRGRHANGTVHNIFGGLARCPVCSSSMTLVNKGEGKGRTYLVCTKAKAGAGCQYRGVPNERVEATFLENAEYLIATAPAGDNGGDLDGRLDGIEGAIQGTEDGIERLLDAIQRGKSPTLVARVRDLEDSLDELRKERDQLEEQRAISSGPLVVRKLADLDKVMEAKKLDRTAANTLLRQLLSAAVVDYRSGMLVLQWRHGGETSVMFGWPDDDLDESTISTA